MSDAPQPQEPLIPPVTPQKAHATGSGASQKRANRDRILYRRRLIAELMRSSISTDEIRAALEKRGEKWAPATIKGDMLAIRMKWREEHRIFVDDAQDQMLAAISADIARLRSFMAGLESGQHDERCAYQDRVTKLMQSYAKIAGLEAPQKIEAKVDTTVVDRRRAIDSLEEVDRQKIADLAAKAYGPRPALAQALNGNGSAPHN